jgi:hypothetical protein
MFRHGLMVLLMLVLSCAAAAQAQPASPTTRPVDFRVLKDLLPDVLGGLRQTSADGETTTAGDATLASASADYSGAEDRADAPQVRVQIVDYAAAPQVAAGIAAWRTEPIDRKTDTGYERTLHIAGQPALEKFNGTSKTGELILFVADRFIVTITTTNVPGEQIVRLAESLPLEDLAGLE